MQKNHPKIHKFDILESENTEFMAFSVKLFAV